MSDDTPHTHYYITPAILPQPDTTDTEWVQRVTMLTDMSEQMLRTAYIYLRINAPMLLDENQLFYHLLAGVGLVLRGIHTTGRERLEKAGTPPLDAQEEQARLIRDELAQPGIAPDLRDALLTILAHNLEMGRTASEPAPTEESSEWPADGFVIGDDSN